MGGAAVRTDGVIRGFGTTLNIVGRGTEDSCLGACTEVVARVPSGGDIVVSS